MLSSSFAYCFIALTLIPHDWDDLMAWVREGRWLFPGWVSDRTVERTCAAVLLASTVLAYVLVLVVDGAPWRLPAVAVIPVHFAWYVATGISHRYLGK